MWCALPFPVYGSVPGLSVVRRWDADVDDSWHPQAVCVGADHTLFEPLGDVEPEARALRRARQAGEEFCQFCPVIAQCAREATKHEYLGVWGGEFRMKRRNIPLVPRDRALRSV